MNTVTGKLPAAARILLGLILLVFGLNGFLQFLPMPPLPDAAGAFLGGLAATGYMFPLIKGVEVLVGAALLLNRFVPLALTVLAPISVNIVAFHLFLDPKGLALPIIVGALNVVLAFFYRARFAGVLSARA